MPIYEFACDACGAKETVFKRSATAGVAAPSCPKCSAAASMRRMLSKFAQHRTLSDQVAEAEARFGKEVDAAMGPGPDVGKYARRFDALAKDLPPGEFRG
ncbi:MAG: FmdB family zinc ribbon protein [Dehalococcoidia bacterium]